MTHCGREVFQGLVEHQRPLLSQLDAGGGEACERDELWIMCECNGWACLKENGFNQE